MASEGQIESWKQLLRAVHICTSGYLLEVPSDDFKEVNPFSETSELLEGWIFSTEKTSQFCNEGQEQSREETN